jgi:hypothetical protein
MAASTAEAAKDPRVPALQAQVRVLKQQNAALTARLDRDEAALAGQLATERTVARSMALDAADCFRVPDWRVFGSFWRLLDIISGATLGTQPFAAWPAYDDHGSCGRLGIIWVSSSQYRR